MPWISCNLQPPRVPVEIGARRLYIHAVPVYKQRNKDKYKQEGAWKQIPLRMRNEFRGDWKYLVCSVYGNVPLHNIQISRFAKPTILRDLSTFYLSELISSPRRPPPLSLLPRRKTKTIATLTFGGAGRGSPSIGVP